MDEIGSALSVGKEVITHTDNVSVPGWSGAGYIILDPETGDGAYKIGGGANGGFYTGLSLGVATGAISVGLFLPGVGLAALIAFILLAALLVFVANMALQLYEEPDDRLCFVVGYVSGAALTRTVGTAFAGKFQSAIDRLMMAILGAWIGSRIDSIKECV